MMALIKVAGIPFPSTAWLLYCAYFTTPRIYASFFLNHNSVLNIAPASRQVLRCHRAAPTWWLHIARNDGSERGSAAPQSWGVRTPSRPCARNNM